MVLGTNTEEPILEYQHIETLAPERNKTQPQELRCRFGREHESRRLGSRRPPSAVTKRFSIKEPACLYIGLWCNTERQTRIARMSAGSRDASCSRLTSNPSSSHAYFSILISAKAEGRRRKESRCFILPEEFVIQAENEFDW